VACARANTLNTVEVVVRYEAKVARNGDPTKRDKKNEVAVINTGQKKLQFRTIMRTEEISVDTHHSKVGVSHNLA
jgi:hypothetical protein